MIYLCIFFNFSALYGVKQDHVLDMIHEYNTGESNPSKNCTFLQIMSLFHVRMQTVGFSLPPSLLPQSSSLGSVHLLSNFTALYHQLRSTPCFTFKSAPSALTLVNFPDIALLYKIQVPLLSSNQSNLFMFPPIHWLYW